MSSQLCATFYQSLTRSQLKWVNAIECLAGIYYIMLMIVGFRNVYVIFIKQGKIASIIFPLMYLSAQAICILQIAQCFMFFSLNHQIEAICSGQEQASSDKL